jgi:hypothetical protein
MRHIKDTRQYSRHERPQTAVSGHRQPHPADSGGGVCWARLAATTLCACGQARACLFFCTHARKACINGLLSASRGKEPTADVKTVCPGSRSRCPQEQHKQGPRHVRLQVLHFVLPNASASHMQAHSHIVGHGVSHARTYITLPCHRIRADRMPRARAQGSGAAVRLAGEAQT